MDGQKEDELRTIVLSVATASGLSVLGVLTAITLSMV